MPSRDLKRKRQKEAKRTEGGNIWCGEGRGDQEEVDGEGEEHPGGKTKTESKCPSCALLLPRAVVFHHRVICSHK